MITVRNDTLSRWILMLLILVCCISFSNKAIYDIYQGIGFYINILAIVFLIIINEKFHIKRFPNYIFLFLLTAYSIFTLFITGGSLGSVLTIAYSILVLFVFLNSEINNLQSKVLLIIFVLINIFLFANSFGYYEKWLYNKGTYINSNTIATVIMYTAIYTKIICQKLNFRFNKLFSLFIYGISFLGILNCESRGALLTLVAFIFLNTFVPNVLKRIRVVIVSLFISVVLLGTIFPFIYVKLYDLGIEPSIPFTSKSLFTGREEIWINYFEGMSNNLGNWIFGLGSDADLWEGEDLNVHNNYLAVITNFGILGYFLYYSFIINLVAKIHKKSNLLNFQLSSLIGFLCVFINGFIEISTLWFAMFFFNFMFLGLAYNNPELETTKR